MADRHSLLFEPRRPAGRRFGLLFSLFFALAAGFTLATLAAGVAGAQEPPDPDAPDLGASERIEALIQRIKYEQQGLKTLRSPFTQVKNSELLLEPETSSGYFWFRAPDAVRWDFAEPNKTRVVVHDGTMLTWFQEQGSAERVDIGSKADRAMEYLSASNSLETLQRYFNLQAVFPKDPESPYRLKLEPRFKRVAKRIKGMTIHLDRQGYFPTYLEYIEPNGDSTELRFTEVEKNVELADDIFDLKLPENVEVRVLELGGRR